METVNELAVLTAATVLAAGAAFGMAWAFLAGAFRLIEPAAVRPQVQRPRLELVRGTRAVARGFVRS
jgi:hypothetical protein